MHKLVYLFAIIFLLSACGGGQQNQEIQDETPATDTTEALVEQAGFFGEEITEEGAMTPDEFLAAIEGQDTIKAKVRTTINSCCQKKGCWMNLDMGDNPEMKVRFKDYGFFVPMDSDGKETIVEGIAYKDVVGVEELKHYAEDAGKSQEEIDAITEPKETMRFLAHGVIIK